MQSVVRRWFSGRAMLLHLAVLVFVGACVAATVWQAGRALGGHGLSWFYTFEWPVLAGIALVGWWQLIHEDPETRAARLREREQVDQADRRAEW